GGRDEQARRAGWLDDHAAVREELLRHVETDDQPEAEGGGARLAARAALVQGPDPDRVLEHDLLRERRLRDPARGADVLQHVSKEADAGAGGAARRPACRPERLRP